MDRRARLRMAAGGAVLGPLAAAVATPLMYIMDESWWPRRLGGILSVYNPVALLVLAWLGPIFGLVSLTALWSARRMKPWSTLLLCAWALPWTLWVDLAGKPMATLHYWLYTAGVHIPSVDSRGLLAGLGGPFELALVASSVLTAGALWALTRSRFVLLVAIGAGVLPVLYFWVPVWLDQPNWSKAWQGSVSGGWMLMV